jgi:HK97 family phage portal protein
LGGVLTKAARKALPVAVGDFWPQDVIAGGTMGGDRSLTGLSVTPDNALAVSAYFAAVRDIAEDMAKMPLKVYRRVGSRREEARDHPAWNVLNRRANPEMSAMTLRETMQGHAIGWGNCYAEKQYNGAGELLALWPLRPDRVRVMRDEVGTLFYRVRVPGKAAIDVDLPREKVFHVPGFGYDGSVGYNILVLMKRVLGLSLAAQEYGERTFRNGAMPGVILRHPGKLGDRARKNIEESWARNHEGLTNAARTAIIEEGMDVETLGFPPEAAQFLGTRTFQIGEIARYVRMPLHKLNELTRATFSNIEQQSMEYVNDTLSSWAGRWESTADISLLDDDALYTRHVFAALLKGDLLQRYQAYNIGRLGGWLTPNDILALEDMNPRDDPGGDEYLVPLNVVEEPSGVQPGAAPAAAGGGEPGAVPSLAGGTLPRVTRVTVERRKAINPNSIRVRDEHGRVTEVLVP